MSQAPVYHKTPVNVSFSNHHGASKEVLEPAKIRRLLNPYMPVDGEYIYSQVFPAEQCVVSPWHNKLFGYNEPVFDINRIVEIVHPQDWDKVWQLTKKACDLIFDDPGKHPSFSYNVSYRIRTKGFRYIRILRQTIPLRLDPQGKIICSLSRCIDISHLNHQKEIKGWLHTPDKVFDLNIPCEHLFSKREKEVLCYLAKGYSSKCIGYKLCISKLTVDKHRANMLHKTKVRNTSELIHYALERGIIE